MTARIQIAVGSDPTIIGSVEANASELCTFSNNDNSAIAGWSWQLLDKPTASTATLSATTTATTTLTPDVPGTYLVRLTTFLDVARTLVDATDVQAVGVRYAGSYPWRLPAARETTQFDADDGWKAEVNLIFDSIRTALIAGGGPVPTWGGSGLRVLLKAADDSFTTQQIGVGSIGNAPTVNDDETEGFLVGSWWVQFIPGEFPNPGTTVLWDCHSNNEGEAIWQQRPLAGTALPLALGVAAVAGTSPTFSPADHVHPTNASNTVALALGAAASAGVALGVSRVDHVHPTNVSNTLPLGPGIASAGVALGASRVDHVHPVQGPSIEEIAIANGVTLASGDAVALVAGRRAAKADGRAGSVVLGYIGQCLVGGTGDAGGTVKAFVTVAGIAPAAGLTAGAPVYLSTTAIGVVTSVVPSGLGAVYQVVGVAGDATSFAIQIDAPVVIDWCSPLDIPTNGIFYGRASSANLLSGGRITTNGVADLFPSSSRVATIDTSGNAPLYVAGGAPNGQDAWFFDSARSDRLRIVHDAGMSGVVWTVAVMHFATSAASQRCLVAKCNGSTPSPIDFHVVGVDEVRLEGSIGLVAKGWRFDAASRPSSGNNAIYSGAARVGGSTISALSAGTDDILIGLRNDLATPYLGRISGFALWNRQLSAAEHVGLAKWARREWAL